MNLDLRTPVQYLKGVGPKLAKVFEKIDVFTVSDLIYYFPIDWLDRSCPDNILSLKIGDECLIKGTIRQVFHEKTGRGFSLVKVVISDASASICVTWFNQPFLEKTFEKLKGKKIFVTGRVDINAYSRSMEIAVRDYEVIDDTEGESSSVIPKYSLTAGLFQKTIRKIMKPTLEKYLPLIVDSLPQGVSNDFNLMPLKSAICQMHFPDSLEQKDLARKRLVFDEFFYLQSAIAIRRKNIRVDSQGIKFNVSEEYLKKFEDTLPFTLTNAQKKVIEAIKVDMSNDKPMNRLIQGDVGSGKTLVAVEAALIAINSGYQVAIMAPTEILAQQHFEKISKFVAPMNIEVKILTGSAKQSKKKKIKEELATETDPCIAIGTHALISDNVAFSNLGLVVVDEQHRFGVESRSKLKQKGVKPDLLVMTATPIPRTLSLTLYGDLDKSNIDELPPGRTPIITKFVSKASRMNMFEFIRQKIKEDNQIYVVCPMIEESEKIDLAAAKETSKILAQIFPEYCVALLHGKLKPVEKEFVMNEFKNNKVNILVSTTVIEVGIDIPNATIMVMEQVEGQNNRSVFFVVLQKRLKAKKE